MNIKQLVRKQIKNIAENFGVNNILGWEIDGTKVYVISYPKSGRTWLRTLVGKALCDYYQIDEKFLLETLVLTRNAKILPTIFSHDMKGSELWNELDTNKSRYRSKKIVFLIRQPHDVMVSFYFHNQNRTHQFNGSISDFIRDERRGIKKLLTYNQIWYEYQDKVKDFLLVRYEDMHQDTISCLSNVLNFIGAGNIPLNIIEDAVEFCQFENMKKKEALNQFQDKRLSTTNSQDENSYKVRKGKVGGYLDYLSQEDIDYINSNITAFGNSWY